MYKNFKNPSKSVKNKVKNFFCKKTEDCNFATVVLGCASSTTMGKNFIKAENAQSARAK